VVHGARELIKIHTKYRVICDKPGAFAKWRKPALAAASARPGQQAQHCPAAHLPIEWRNHPFEFDGLPGRP
jgi:hypothetical protein